MPTHYRACNLCEAICGLAVEHENGKALSIRGDEQDPLRRRPSRASSKVG